MPAWRAVSVSALALMLGGCMFGETPERARILAVQPVADGSALEITQRLQFSQHMREALDYGIPLRLVYAIDACGSPQQQRRMIEMRYSPLQREYQLHGLAGQPVRHFSRASALFAALDRIRIPLPVKAADCAGQLQMALDLTALPTPLRFPAFLQPSQWRMVSPEFEWIAVRP